MENQQIANLRLRELAGHHEATFFLREHVTGFAERACDNGIDRFVEFAAVAGDNRNGMIATVKTRTNEIGKAGVYQVEQVVALLLDGADFSHQVTAFGHQIATGFHFKVHLVADALLNALAGIVPQLVVGVHVDAVALVFFVVGNREAAPCTDGAQVATQATASVDHGIANLSEVFKIRAGTDMHMQSRNPHAVSLSELDTILDLFVPDAVLAEVATGVGLAGMTVAKARVHADGEFRLHAEISELLDHVRRTHVHGDVVFFHEFKSILVEDVCGVDNFGSLALLLAALESGLEGAHDFACRNGVDDAAELADERNHGKVRACLLGKANGVENLDILHALFNRSAIINPEGSAVLFGSLHKNFLRDGIICHTEKI